MNKKVDINRSNYELFVIDYIEGSLDAIDMESFAAFLDSNPDIKDEIYELESITIETENIIYKPKSELKKKSIVGGKEIVESNYQNYFIAFHEKDLNKLSEKSLTEFLLLNPQLNSEFEVFGKLKIEPDNKFTFTNKDQLKHKYRIAPLWYSSAAAIVLLITSWWYIVDQNNSRLRNDNISIGQIISKVTNTLNTSNNELVIGLEVTKITTSLIPENLSSEQEEIALLNLTEYTNDQERQKNVPLSIIESKNSVDPLIDRYEFSRLLAQNKTNTSTMDLQKIQPEMAMVESPKKKGVFASILNGQFKKLTANLKARKKKNNASTDPTYVKMIDGGILVFNTLTGSETYTSKTYSQQGELQSYQIEGQEILLSKNTSNKVAH